jgi:hypothetical protein
MTERMNETTGEAKPLLAIIVASNPDRDHEETDEDDTT